MHYESFWRYDLPPRIRPFWNTIWTKERGTTDEPKQAHGSADHRCAQAMEAGRRAEDVARDQGVSKHTIYAWKAKYGGLEVSEAKRLRALEAENRKLKQLLADTMLENHAIKDVLSKKF